MGNRTRAAQQAHRKIVRGIRTVEGNKGVYQLQVIPGPVILANIMRWVNDLPVQNPQEVEAAAQWVLNCFKTPHGDDYQCLNCDRKFNRKASPPMFFVMMRGENAFVISGVCKGCGYGKDIHEIGAIAVEQYKRGFFGGDTTIASSGEGRA